MDPAIRLYRELGFRETHVQDHDPIGRFLYMELALDD
jgi:ribosomal protein S18 acetylase RimI-like enzyme